MTNQSILKEISPECLLEGLILKLKLQYFGHMMGRVNWLEKTLKQGKIEGRRRKEWQRMRWMASLILWTWVWASLGSWWWTGKPGVLQSMGSQRVGHDWVTELNWEVFVFSLSSVLLWENWRRVWHSWQFIVLGGFLIIHWKCLCGVFHLGKIGFDHIHW